jgi:hypothetical protein
MCLQKQLDLSQDILTDLHSTFLQYCLLVILTAIEQVGVDESN